MNPEEDKKQETEDLMNFFPCLKAVCRLERGKEISP